MSGELMRRGIDEVRHVYAPVKNRGEGKEFLPYMFYEEMAETVFHLHIDMLSPVINVGQSMSGIGTVSTP